MKRRYKALIIITPLLLIAAFLSLRNSSSNKEDFLANITESPYADTISPAAEIPKSSPKNQLDTISEEDSVLPSSYSIKVPFIVQAPLADWSAPFNHACEEASIIMIHQYFKNQSLAPDEAKDAILAMTNFEVQKYGSHEDTASAQTVELIKDYYGYDAEVRYNITLDDIKRELIKDNPVIVPTNGKVLANPYFTPPGPDYHMLVITGYTPDRFITNDPGTKRGENLSYTYENLEKSIQDWGLMDWDTGDGTHGPTAMIIIKRS
ncbi:MAG: hypothetical protein COU07_02105 [Candidatus Harrisonbacteria bacterium CG10_big_fil_rev_8_21_14_0_10_40_38]|uniref:Peptidase C39-like domain-containing protein n=1 Tax=Candidatus Harrisonbacteria bacterium CG10_big_fil_rev_8_21_14_0_10_40_38 TaxID=1974583 RepID=A0A2H0US43_9BACT|nr:MAG: hypothetical protein COU07_02105 [Candidatus Harrisonbacteria bacterium CG10_big_fil_rev_8_21_14_0_10_40_38]